MEVTLFVLFDKRMIILELCISLLSSWWLSMSLHSLLNRLVSSKERWTGRSNSPVSPNIYVRDAGLECSPNRGVYKARF
ncbi:hypothetical protein F5Y09DRAFT_307474 [Xylaria sp. FL1042]|nr:hypothetical protein F5Y09DRAFT_307474 [Xylaria sp. FL1042]